MRLYIVIWGASLLACGSPLSAQLDVHGIDWFPTPNHVVRSAADWDTVPSDATSIHLERPAIADVEQLLEREFLSEITLSQSGEKAPSEVLRALHRLPRLSFLGLRWIAGDAETLEAISRLPRIERLAMHGCTELDPAGLLKLKDSESLRALGVIEARNLYGAHADALSQLKQLVHLRIDRCTWRKGPVRRDQDGVVLEPRDAKRLVPLARLTNLLTLSIAEAAVCAETTKAIASLPRLTGLSLFKCSGVDDESVAELAACSKLEVLDIGYDNIFMLPRLGDTAFAAIARCTKLRVLWLQLRTELSPAHFKSLANGCQGLAELRMPGEALDAGALTQLARLPELSVLTLNWEKEPDTAALRRFAELIELRELTLIGAGIGQSLALIPWTQMTKLVTCRLLDVGLSKSGLQALSKAPALTILEVKLPPISSLSVDDLIHAETSLKTLIIHSADWHAEELSRIKKDIGSEVVVVIK